MTKYLLSCSCGKLNPIDLAQAGETIHCQCGATIAAPTMRGIKALPVVADATPARRARVWGPGQGLTFLGVVVSLAGLATLVYFYGTAPRLDLGKIPPQFESITPIDSWRVWELFQHGLPGPPTPETMQIIKGAQARQQVFTTGCVVVALGVVIAAIGVAYILAFEPRRKKNIMKAAFIRETGSPENIVYDDLPTPTPGHGQALVKVHAVAVNPIDTYIRSGAVAMPLPLPFVVGCDLAGIVAEVGPGVTKFQVGQRVWGSNQGLLGRQGTFAEYAAVDEHWLYHLPPGVEYEHAAAVALVGITAHLGLVRDVRLRAGETLFVNGGAGGVGSMVVQMAKALGARVATTAGSDLKREHCRRLGAEMAIDYKHDDLATRLKQFAPDGVDVFWETQREPNFDLAVSLLAPRGRMIVMAGRDARPTFPVGPFYVKGCSLHGFAMFNASPAEQQTAADDINRWLTSGQLQAQIGHEGPLSQAAAAHRMQEENTLQKAGTLTGKIVLKP